MFETTVVLNVGMSCQGCVGAVQMVLEKMEGVESFDIDKNEQKVTVKGNVQPEAVLQNVSKTGKKTSFWKAEPPAKPDENITEAMPDEVDATEGNPTKTAPETKPAEAEPKRKSSEAAKNIETEPETEPAEAGSPGAGPEMKTQEAVATA